MRRHKNEMVRLAFAALAATCLIALNTAIPVGHKTVYKSISSGPCKYVHPGKGVHCEIQGDGKTLDLDDGLPECRKVEGEGNSMKWAHRQFTCKNLGKGASDNSDDGGEGDDGPEGDDNGDDGNKDHDEGGHNTSSNTSAKPHKKTYHPQHVHVHPNESRNGENVHISSPNTTAKPLKNTSHAGNSQVHHHNREHSASRKGDDDVDDVGEDGEDDDKKKKVHAGHSPEGKTGAEHHHGKRGGDDDDDNDGGHDDGDDRDDDTYIKGVTNGANSSENKTAKATCFPGSSMVALEGGRTIKMSELLIGDRVSVGGGKYSQVFMFTHKLPLARTEFVELTTAIGSTLRLTAGHYLPVNSSYTAAADVVVGDSVELSDGTHSKVTCVEYVTDDGLYNPQTFSGTIVVDGIVASVYTKAVAPTAAHAMLTPLRSLFSRFGLTVELDSGNDLAVGFAPSAGGTFVVV